MKNGLFNALIVGPVKGFTILGAALYFVVGATAAATVMMAIFVAIGWGVGFTIAGVPKLASSISQAQKAAENTGGAKLGGPEKNADGSKGQPKITVKDKNGKDITDQYLKEHPLGK